MYTDINNSLNSLVYKTNTILKSKLQAALNGFDITSEQWVTLERLHEKDGCNQKELSVDSFKEQAAITRTLDILEKKGLVERRKSEVDRREFLIFITKKGINLLEVVLPHVKLYRDSLQSILTQEETGTLTFLLNKLCNGSISSQ
jgi:DNA-binding MarR family transcriptional regulator